MKIIIIFLVISGILYGCDTKIDPPYLIMFSFDGFRFDQADSVELPNLKNIAITGVKAQWMIPVVPTVTFPNHYAIATGLYPEHNGIPNNRFYNCRLGKEYNSNNIKNTTDSSFYRGMPLWNYLQNKGIKTATCSWVGSNAFINEKFANYRLESLSMPFKQELDTLLFWLRLPVEKRPHLIMAYYPEPDDVGHEFGPFGKPTLKKIQYIDSLLGYFREQISKMKIAGKINIIILSDHGMAVADSTKNIFIPKKASDQYIDMMEGGTQSIFVYAKKGKHDKLLNYLKQYKHINSFVRPNFPKNWHLNDTTTVPNIVLLADEGYNIHIQGEALKKGGCHGYDNTVNSMRTIFYATGPAFKKNYKQQPFENVDIFPLICKIFGVESTVNDGKISEVEGMLTDQKNK